MPKALALSARRIALDLIDEPKGIIRLEIDPGRLQDLVESIKEVGLLQPIIVRPVGDRFEIVFGHRRCLAHKILKAGKIACVVRVLSDVECAIMRGTENVQRDDLSPIEEAAIYSDLHDNHGLSYDDIGKRMSKSVGIVKRRLDLLRMPPQLQKAIHKKQIGYAVAEELWSIGDIGGIDYYLSFAIEHGVTQAVARSWAKEWKDQKRRAAGGTGEGEGVGNPLEPRPTYLPCDICLGPEDVQKMELIHCCKKCAKKLREALSVSET
ncbi:Nucleoid occlusion protein [subsurface metagenome]